MQIPDPKYIAMFPLQEVIHDKDTGDLLAAGTVRFWSDPLWTVPKDVYQQSQTSSGTYVFTNMGNVITLNSIGAMADNNGTDIIPFLYPYNSNGELELYFIQVYSAGGVLQFTREGWPPSMLANINPVEPGAVSTQNELTNPQFVDVLFGTSSYVFNVTGINTQTQIAPSWFIQTSGAGTVTIQQVATAAIDIVSNPPYVLDINGSSGVTTLNLVQRLSKSPRLLAGGIVAGYFIAKTQTGTAAIPLTLSYIPSTGSSYVIATGSTTGGSDYVAIKDSVAIDGTINNDPSNTGYVDISLSIPTNTNVRVSSFQIIGIPAPLVLGSPDVPDFIELTTPQQINGLFYYYKPELIYKPIPSYLVGWDFPLNPAQTTSEVLNYAFGPFATTANKSFYGWDQTIVFQTVDSSINGLRSTTTGALQIHATLASSFAVIQYLPQAQAREILSQRNAVQLKASIDSGTLNGTVSIYWTQDASLPSIKSPTYNSIVSSITAGVPAASNGSWNKVARDTLSNPAIFTLTSDNQVFDFLGFDDTATTGKTTATFFAIVISFDTLTLGSTVSIEYCSLVGGDIATRPAPQSYNAVLIDCSYYYQKSFQPGIKPVDFTGSADLNLGESYGIATSLSGSPVASRGPLITYPVPLIRVPIISIYSPGGASSGQIYDITTNFSCTSTSHSSGSTRSFSTQCQNAVGGAVGDLLAVNWTADSRLGTY